MVLWSYAGPKHQDEALHQEWIFFQAYSIYCNLFTVKTEIKSSQIIWAENNMFKFLQSTEYDVHMYAKIQCENIHRYFSIIYSSFAFLIFYTMQ
jgi:hypothetical protein